jgi:hypothetical protein
MTSGEYLIACFFIGSIISNVGASSIFGAVHYGPQSDRGKYRVVRKLYTRDPTHKLNESKSSIKT